MSCETLINYNSHKHRAFLLVVAVLVIGLPACSHVDSALPNHSSTIPQHESKAINTSQSVTAVSNNVSRKLYKQYQQWRGTPYKMGGLTKKGVDCSGFVYLTYQYLFNIQLPRTTAQQARAGTPVSKQDLRPGDLLFFKTEWKSGHVGIYLDNQAFLHASTKKGVMISRLDDYYWKPRYLQARRISKR